MPWAAATSAPVERRSGGSERRDKDATAATPRAPKTLNARRIDQLVSFLAYVDFIDRHYQELPGMTLVIGVIMLCPTAPSGGAAAALPAAGAARRRG